MLSDFDPLFINIEQEIIQIINIPSIIRWNKPAYFVKGSDINKPTNTMLINPQMIPIFDNPR